MPERFKVVCIPCKALYRCSALPLPLPVSEFGVAFGRGGKGSKRDEGREWKKKEGTEGKRGEGKGIEEKRSVEKVLIAIEIPYFTHC